jgi:DNA mismatch repair ATPase MutS
LLERAALRADDVASHMALMRQAETLQPQAARLTFLRAQLADGNAGAALVRLERILTWSEVRHNSVLYPIVQLLLLYDVHLAGALERWQSEHGARVRAWFAALGEIEAVAALATLAYENPAWVFPRFADELRVSARGLAHPLIPYARRVANDVEVGPPSSFLLVTGSNLAGKTTLIRALGANTVLANAGAPVCAEFFSLPQLRVQTSMHIHDVLEDGLSLFSAELRRIRSIVDAARTPGQPAVLYLLDELLRGTNAEERRVAIATILRHLLKAGAIGAITTHDLALASESSLERAAVAVHFTEHFEPGDDGPIMRFDYRLRPGPATSSNALALLRIMGLGEDQN